MTGLGSVLLGLWLSVTFAPPTQHLSLPHQSDCRTGSAVCLGSVLARKGLLAACYNRLGLKAADDRRERVLIMFGVLCVCACVLRYSSLNRPVGEGEGKVIAVAGQRERVIDVIVRVKDWRSLTWMGMRSWPRSAVDLIASNEISAIICNNSAILHFHQPPLQSSEPFPSTDSRQIAEVGDLCASGWDEA